MNRTDVFTIGHSDLSYELFVKRLHQQNVSAIADVRSSPFSRRSPWFSAPELKRALKESQVAYVFLGAELGGRPATKSLYTRGVADYEAMSKTASFQAGIKRIVGGSERYRIALMCSERDPLHCHRCLLVGRALKRERFDVNHVLFDGSVEDQASSETRLLREEGLFDDFVVDREKRLDDAYRMRSKKVAFSERGVNLS